MSVKQTVSLRCFVDVLFGFVDSAETECFVWKPSVFDCHARQTNSLLHINEERQKRWR